MGPKRVLIIRHAEKPDNPYNPDLSEAGKQRARNLAKFIPERFGACDFIFAAAISRHSARPYETVRRLSKTIGIPVDATIASNDYSVLAQELVKKPKYEGSLILVCWHHGQIPPLLHALSAPGGSYPNPWSRNVFDLMIEMKFRDDSVPKVKEVTQPF
jgi:broad specificity phosphatase PhoE